MNNSIKIIEIEKGNDKIGFNINGNTFEIHVPKYYYNDITDIDKSNEKLKKMFKAWKKYQKRNNSLLGNQYIKDNGFFNLDVAMNIIQDYVENGLFIEQENSYVISNYGKMNFKKTIGKCNPLYTHQGPVYLKYIVNSKKENDEYLLKQIQIQILNDISKKIGWIIGFDFKVNNKNLYLSYKTIILKLKELQNQSFNSRKLNLIHLLIEYIDSNITTENGGNIFVGMANLFWQDMINEVVGNVSKVDLEKYFYVRHVYNLAKNDKNLISLSSLMPDSVFKDSKNIIIIDSKYYINNTLPDNNDINKQIIYMMKAEGIFPNYNNYSNCFILPTDKDNNYGDVQAIFDEAIEKNHLTTINVLYANLERILNKYIENEKDIDILKAIIIN